MFDLQKLMEWEILTFLLALAGLVVVQLLTGAINTNGFFCGRVSGRRRGEDQYFSPERVQLLVFTLGAASHYVSQVLTNLHPGTFPPMPEGWLAVVGGSNAIYLGGKTYARWFANGSSK